VASVGSEGRCPACARDPKPGCQAALRSAAPALLATLKSLAGAAHEQPIGAWFYAVMTDQPFVDSWPTWDEPLSKIPRAQVAFDLGQAHQRASRQVHQSKTRAG
jgi:hypothetical protein